MWQHVQGTAMEFLGVIHELSNKSDKKTALQFSFQIILKLCSVHNNQSSGAGSEGSVTFWSSRTGGSKITCFD
jgi:hypothetical protein